MRRPRHPSPDPRRTDMGSDPRHGSRAGMEACRQRLAPRRWGRGLPRHRRPRHVDAPAGWWPEVPAWVTSAWPAAALPRRRHRAWAPGMVLPELEASPRWTHGWAPLKARHTSCRVRTSRPKRHPDAPKPSRCSGRETTPPWACATSTSPSPRGGALEGELDIAARALHADPWITWLSSGEPSDEAVLLASGSRWPSAWPPTALVGGAGMHGCSDPSEGATRPMQAPQRGPSRA